jgi:hypothetical protein
MRSTGTKAAHLRIDSGEVVPGKRWSILIVVLGRFVATDVPIPPGAAAPRGSAMSMVYDVGSGKGTDSGLGDEIPDLSELAGSHVDQLDRARIGTVVGAIRFAGGRADDHRAKQGGVVTVFKPDGFVVTTQNVRRGHSFRFFLRIRPRAGRCGR